MTSSFNQRNVAKCCNLSLPGCLAAWTGANSEGGGGLQASHSVGIFRKPLPILRGLRFSVLVHSNCLERFSAIKTKTQRWNSKNSNVEIILLKSGKIIRKKSRDNFQFFCSKIKKRKNLKKKLGQNVQINCFDGFWEFILISAKIWMKKKLVKQSEWGTRQFIGGGLKWVFKMRKNIQKWVKVRNCTSLVWG